MKKNVINVTGMKTIDFKYNQVYTCDRMYKGRKCHLYDLSTDCQRVSTAIKRLASAVPALQNVLDNYLKVGYASQLSMTHDEIAVKETDFGYYVMAVIFEKEIVENHITGEVIYTAFNGDCVKTFITFEEAENYYDSIKCSYDKVQLYFIKDNQKSLMDETINKKLDYTQNGCNINNDDTNIKNKENESMEENTTIIEEAEVQELLPIEPDYITRTINEANLVNAELVERTMDILYLEEDNRRNLFKIATQLGKIHKGKLYEDDGFKNISEYAEKVLAYKSSTTRALCRIADRFLNELGEIKNPELADFSVYQLMELLKLNDSELQLALTDGTVSSELSTKKLRDNIKNSKSPETEETSDEKPINQDKENTPKQVDVEPNEINTETEDTPDTKLTNKQGQAITILTSLIRQIAQNENLESHITELYINQIKHAIECIK